MVTRILLIAVLFTALTSAQNSNSCLNDCTSHGICVQSKCECSTGWSGDDCSIPFAPIAANTWVNGTLPSMSWNYYAFSNAQTGTNIRFEMKPGDSPSGDCDIYVKKGSLPTTINYDYANIDWGTDSTIIVNDSVATTYYVGIYSGYMRCRYRFRVVPTGACENQCVHGVCQYHYGDSGGTCVCQEGWSGPTCEQAVGSALRLETEYQGTVLKDQWTYYYFDLNSTQPLVNIIVNITNPNIEAHDCDVYVRRDQLPTFVFWDYKDATANANFVISVPNATIGKWYIGVWGFRQCDFKLKVSPVQNCINKCSKRGSCQAPVCRCNPGYSGGYCETKTAALNFDEFVTGYVDQNTWNYYTFKAPLTQENIVIQVNQEPSEKGDCDIYIRKGKKPTRSRYDYLEISQSDTFNLTITDVVNQTLYIGVFGWETCEYNMTIKATTGCSGCDHGNCTEQGICECYPGWGGEFCDKPQSNVEFGKAISDHIDSSNQWKYYRFNSTSTTVIVSMKETQTDAAGGFLYLFLSEGSNPTIEMHDYEDVDFNKPFHTIPLYLDSRQGEEIEWVIGVYGSPYLIRQTPYNLVVWQSNI